MNYIFDFDGTLIDSMGAMIEIFNDNVRDPSNPLTKQEIERFRNMPSKKALRLAGIRWWQMPKLLIRFMPEFRKKLPGLKPFEGIEEMLEVLHKRNCKMYIVSTNSSSSVKEFLEINKLEKYFVEISGGSSLFNKAKHIRRLMAKNKLKRKETIYIGDETRDIAAAKIARVKSVAVCWGFNSQQILKKRLPTYIVNTPQQILDIKL